MRWTVRPISDVTGFGGGWQESQFTVTWTQAVTLLERELDQLDASEVVLEIDLRENQIRLDGQVRADAKAASGRVRLAFESKHGALVYATDRFTRGWSGRGGVRKMPEDWQHNVYAIAKALEALRLVDRYGVTSGQQYTGFRALGGGTPMPAGPVQMSADEAWGILGSFGEGPIAQQRLAPDGLSKAHRRARAFAHPDRHGGDQKLWDQVERAAIVLGVAR